MCKDEQGAAETGRIPRPAIGREFTAEAPMTEERTVEALFTYHAPDYLQQQQYARIRAAAKSLALTILDACPPCADRSDAIRKVREAVMTANAAIALRGLV